MYVHFICSFILIDLQAKNIPAAEADLQRRLGLEPTQSSQGFRSCGGLTTLSTLCLDIVISVDPNSATGFKGLPVEWEALVKSSCITKEEVIEHPRQVLEVSFLAGLLISLLTFSRPLNFKLQLLSLKM